VYCCGRGDSALCRAVPAKGLESLESQSQSYSKRSDLEVSVGWASPSSQGPFGGLSAALVATVWLALEHLLPTRCARHVPSGVQ
jgi:hypothetical protein